MEKRNYKYRLEENKKRNYDFFKPYIDGEVKRIKIKLHYLSRKDLEVGKKKKTIK